MVSAMREAHLEPPQFEDHHDYFKVVFSNQALLDQESLAWLNQFAKIPFNSRQRTALAYLRKHEQMTNSDYCRLNNLDSVAATKELKGLVESELVDMHGTRRWAYYRLATKQLPGKQTRFAFEDKDLNLRQVLALKWIEEKGFITSKQYETLSSPPISDKTAQNDLNELENKGILRRVGKARGIRYVLSVNDLN